MFKSSTIFYAIVFSAFSSASFAAAATSATVEKPTNVVIVNSTVRNLSATTIGNEIHYTKTFDIVIVNGEKSPIDLSKGCFKAVMPDKTEIPMDTIQGELAEGQLKAESSLKGFVGFSAADESIYKAVAVKYVPVCK